MHNAKIDTGCRDFLKRTYDKAIIQIQITEDTITPRMKIKQGVRQGDTISSKLFILALEDVLQRLNSEELGVMIDGRYLSHLRFAADIMIISNSIEELKAMFEELKCES